MWIPAFWWKQNKGGFTLHTNSPISIMLLSALHWPEQTALCLNCCTFSLLFLFKSWYFDTKKMRVILLEERRMHTRIKLCLGFVLPCEIFQGLEKQRGIAWLSQTLVEAVEGGRDQVCHFAFWYCWGLYAEGSFVALYSAGPIVKLSLNSSQSWKWKVDIHIHFYSETNWNPKQLWKQGKQGKICFIPEII